MSAKRSVCLALTAAWGFLAAAGCTSDAGDRGAAATSVPQTPVGVVVASATPQEPEGTPMSGTPTPTAPPAVATTGAPLAAYVPDLALGTLLQDLVGESRQSYAVYVKNLSDGTGASVNPDRVYRAASLFKLYVMWEAFRQESVGLIRFDETMEVTPYYKSWELGTNAVEVGDLVTVEEALRLMISISDTPSGVLLQDRLGFANVNTALEGLGIQDSGLFYPGDPVATARDVGVLLEAIAGGSILPNDAHDAMVALLTSSGIDYGLRAGVPAAVAVGHKTGSLETALHDAGVVFAPGGAYVIVILWDREGDANLIEAISRLVYDYYEES